MATSTRKSMDKLGKRKKLEDQSLDEFLTGFTNSDSNGSVESTPKKSKKINKKAKKPTLVPEKKVSKKKPVKGEDKHVGVFASHKSSLDKLKEQDPEFYEFLQKEDESLLNFDVSDSDITDASDDGEESEADSDSKTDSDDEEMDIPMSSDDDEEEKGMNVPKVKDSKGKKEGKEKSVKKKADEVPKKKTKAKEGKEKKADKKKAGEVTADIDDVETDSDSDEEMYHQPPETLEEAKDSDDEEEGDVGQGSGKQGIKVTLSMVDQWTKRFKEQPSPSLIATVAQVLKAAVQKTSRDSEETKYSVVGGSVFNAVVRMCLVEMPPALHKLLDLQTTTNLQKPALPSVKDKRWIKIKSHVKFYLKDILKLMSDISEVSMVNVLLKHIHKLVAFYACDTKLMKMLLKKAISIWSTGEETSRVLAFLIINRLIKVNAGISLEDCIKKLYMAYVRNCKFTSPNTLPLINFMQRSFVEIISLDIELAYQYAFMYIRQLAIHLRNATATKKKESCQAVYNWQYVHCIVLWSRVMSMTYPNEVLEPLIYPLVQTIIGTIKLIPTQRYYPLRFHCVQALTMISKATNIYIPVLPFLLEVFEQTDFNKKHKAINFKPFNFACVLKFSKTQLQERAFKDGLIDQLYELLLEFFAVHAHTIGFRNWFYQHSFRKYNTFCWRSFINKEHVDSICKKFNPDRLHLKDFLKQCKVGNFTKQVKQIYDKVCENATFITARRGKTAFTLSDTKAIAMWERECKEAGTPLGKFYSSWRKLRDRELMHQIAAKEQIVGESTVPEIVRPKLPRAPTEEDKKEFAALFDSDSDDNNIDFSESFLPPAEKKQLRLERQKEQSKGDKKGAQKKKKQGSDSEEYSDFDSDDLAQLAGSGDDDDDDVEDDDAEEGSDEDINDDDDDHSDDEDDEEEDDGDEKADIVEDFAMSSDED